MVDVENNTRTSDLTVHFACSLIAFHFHFIGFHLRNECIDRQVNFNSKAMALRAAEVEAEDVPHIFAQYTRLSNQLLIFYEAT